MNKKGKFEKPEVLRSLGRGCEQEAIRVIEEAEFVPGKQRGKTVRI